MSVEYIHELRQTRRTSSFLKRACSAPHRHTNKAFLPLLKEFSGHKRVGFFCRGPVEAPFLAVYSSSCHQTYRSSAKHKNRSETNPDSSVTFLQPSPPRINIPPCQPKLVKKKHPVFLPSRVFPTALSKPTKLPS